MLDRVNISMEIHQGVSKLLIEKVKDIPKAKLHLNGCQKNNHGSGLTQGSVYFLAKQTSGRLTNSL